LRLSTRKGGNYEITSVGKNDSETSFFKELSFGDYSFQRKTN